MSEIFTNILTQIGQQKKAQAEATGTTLEITTFKVGDSNGSYYQPNENQTALVNAKYTGSFEEGTQSQVVINASATNEVLYKCFIPADVGGFTIRELGLFDSDGDLILICKLPAQDKFSLESGLYQPLTFTPKIIYTNPQTQAVLTPTSQTVPTTGEVVNIVETSIQEAVGNIEYIAPIVKSNDAISLQIDESLKLKDGKLSVCQNLSTIFAINSGNTTNGEADILYAPGNGTAETPFIQPALSSNGTMGGPTFAVRASYCYPGYYAHLASDGNSGTNWDANGTTYPCNYDCWNPKKLRMLSITMMIVANWNTQFIVQGSDDDNAWVDLTGTLTLTGANYTLQTLSVNSATAYYYHRIKIVGGGYYPQYSQISWNAMEVQSISTSTTCFFKIGGSYPDLALTFADKSQEILTSLASITGLTTNGTYTVLKEKGQNPIAVLSSKVGQGKTFPTSFANGDYFCLTATELQTYKSISGEWVEIQYIVLGSLIVSSGVISSVKTNQFNQNGYDVNVYSQGYRMPDYDKAIYMTGCNTPKQVFEDSFVCIWGTDPYMEGWGAFVGKTAAGPWNRVGLRSDDTNGNTEGTSFSFFVPQNWYFYGTAEHNTSASVFPLKGA